MDFRTTEAHELVRRNIREFVEKLMKIAEVYEGPSEVQRLVIYGSVLR